jgi:hypothetical protein
MPTLSQTFEFDNTWVTKNSYTTKPSITMPQMVNGLRAGPVLTINSERLPAAGYYGLGSRTHNVAYVIEGSFRGTCMMQASNVPNPSETDWMPLTETFVKYTGFETTGGAGISGGFSSTVSKPTVTTMCAFTGNYAWLRVALSISKEPCK